MRFLVVEDEAAVAEVLRRSLEHLGNSCLLANDAARADLLLQDHRIDAVTVDLGMPDRSGLDWLEAVAANRPELARRALVITGQPLEPGVVERVGRCGAGVLAKPFTLESLADAVRSQIDWPGGPHAD
jgi:DNA-binding response OmpR family regulator